MGNVVEFSVTMRPAARASMGPSKEIGITCTPIKPGRSGRSSRGEENEMSKDYKPGDECPNCNSKAWPSVQGMEQAPSLSGRQDGKLTFRASYNCAQCAQHLGWCEPHGGAAKMDAKSEPLKVPVPPSASIPTLSMPETFALPPVGSSSFVTMLRQRVEALNAELVKADAIREERDALVRMLRAADRKPKASKFAPAPVQSLGLPFGGNGDNADPPVIETMGVPPGVIVAGNERAPS